MRNGFLSIEEIVTSGFCMGCGLCASPSITANKVEMGADSLRRPRPQQLEPLSPDETQAVLSVCPGINVVSADEGKTVEALDPVWGRVRQLRLGHATDPALRFQAATGGIITALAIHLLESGRVSKVLQVRPDPERPLNAIPHVSSRPEDVLAATGSRYGPASPLTIVSQLLEEGEPFAAALKPCDIAGLRNLQKHDPRARELIKFTMAMFCGTTPDLGPNLAFLDRNNIQEEDLVRYSWRGNGCPGPVRAETADGRVAETNYNDLWLAAPFKAQFRCRVCPDAVGELADIATGDCWPGGEPKGEDAGWNAIVAHTVVGQDILAEAETAGAIATQDYDLAQLNAAQPHHVRLKQELKVRLEASYDAGKPRANFRGMRLDTLNYQLSRDDQVRIRAATMQRIESGATSETFEMPDT
jgi:coenzyme F420 hydrogenase subunit beta